MDYERYQRQLRLPHFGVEGQQKLQQARVLVIGAGGLGCPALQYLVGAGVGQIGIIDFDVVSLSNLHRQVLYTVDDLGKSKVMCAKAALEKLNPQVQIHAYDTTLDQQNVISLFSSYDFIIDGSDNFPTRYLVSDASEALGIPLVYGAVSKFEGQVAVFNKADAQGKKVTYRDLFPQPPRSNEVENCAEGGVLGVLPGMIGTFQATEALKLITGIGQPLTNQLFTYQALYNQFYTIQLQPDPNRIPATLASIAQQDYPIECGLEPIDVQAISFSEIEQLRATNAEIQFIDVREYHEFPPIETDDVIQLPFSTLPKAKVELDRPLATYITTCASGKRSLPAASLIQAQTGKNIRYYEGSILDLFDL